MYVSVLFSSDNNIIRIFLEFGHTLNSLELTNQC